MRRRDGLLTILILCGMVAGVVLGELLHRGTLPGDEISAAWDQAGNLVLIRPLMALIMPLIFVSVVVGVTSIGNPSRLGVLGGSTILYFLATMLLAVILGTVLVTTIGPGRGLDPNDIATLMGEELPRAEVEAAQSRVDESVASNGDSIRSNAAPDDAVDRGDGEGASARPGAPRESRARAPSPETVERVRAAESLGVGGAWMNIVEQMVPRNIAAEISEGRPLGVIAGAILLGLALALGGDRAKPAIRFFEAIFDALMLIVSWIIWLAPLGVFLLVTATVGRLGIDAIRGPLAGYIGTVTLGLLLHGFVVLPMVLLIFGRTNPWRFFWRMRPALLTALGTSSSSATLPVTLRCAVGPNGSSRRAGNFVLPLGTTVNMDGTALYEAVAVIFLFQLYGIQLGFAELLVVVLTATLAAVGAAGIPSAGLVTMVIVVTAVNTSLSVTDPSRQLPIEAIGIILGVDRVLDMMRTSVNVWGDAIGARIITRLAPDDDDVGDA